MRGGCVLLLLLALPSTDDVLFAQSSEKSGFLNWPRDYCRDILKRHTQKISIHDMHWATALSGGIGKITEGEMDFFVWITEPAAKAYTRLIQLKAHLSDTEAEEVYKQLRPVGRDFITIAMFSRSVELGWTSIVGVTVDEGDKPDSPGKRDVDPKRNLFLTHREDQEQAARIEKIEELPDEVIVPTVSRFDTAYGSLLRFTRTTQDGKPLVESLRDEILISFYRLGKPRKTKFKVRDFRISNLEEL